MSLELKTWRCGHCPFTIDIPSERNGYEYADAIARVHEHRFGHLVEALTSSSDDDLWRLCGDEPTDQSADACLSRLGNLGCRAAPPVDSEDITPVLKGIMELLRADLPRARCLWYPINEDGGFSR